MTLVLVVVVVVIALACGGRIRDLERVDIRHVWLFPAAVAFMVALNYAKFHNFLSEDLTRVAQPGIYLFIIAALIANRHIEGAGLLAFGTFLNFLVIAANRGYMPVSMTALKTSGLTQKDLADLMYLRHAPMTEETPLWFLGDILPVPWPPIFRGVGSVGDLVVMLALTIIVWRLFFPSRTSSSKDLKTGIPNKRGA